MLYIITSIVIATPSPSIDYRINFDGPHLARQVCDKSDISCLLVKKYWGDFLNKPGYLIISPDYEKSNAVVNEYIQRKKISKSQILYDLKIRFYMNAHIIRSPILVKNNFLNISKTKIVFLSNNDQKISYKDGCFNKYYCIKWPNLPQTDSMGVPNIVEINKPLVSTLIK